GDLSAGDARRPEDRSEYRRRPRGARRLDTNASSNSSGALDPATAASSAATALLSGRRPAEGRDAARPSLGLVRTTFEPFSRLLARGSRFVRRPDRIRRDRGKEMRFLVTGHAPRRLA